MHARIRTYAALSSGFNVCFARELGSRAAKLERVAADHGMTARTLQRRMREQNTSFSAKLRRAKRDRASYYLRESLVPVGDIARLLGFEDASSFHRAFVRWTGSTPGSFRAAALARRRTFRYVQARSRTSVEGRPAHGSEAASFGGSDPNPLS
jgi:AraC-like DNA-binding protein